jgi:hypothetical protein
MTTSKKYRYYCQPEGEHRWEMSGKYDPDHVKAMEAVSTLCDYVGSDSLRLIFEDDDTGEDYIDTWSREEIIATPEEIVRRLVAWNHKDGSSLVDLGAEAEKVVRALDKAMV